MRWNLKSLSILPIFIILIGMQIFISTRSKEKDEPPQVIKQPTTNKITQSLSGIHVIENNQSAKAWELWATKGSLNAIGNQWEVEDIKMIFFAEDGLTYELTSLVGVLTSNQKQDVTKLDLKGKVITKASNGYTFYSEEAHYEKDKHMLVFPNDIKIIGPLQNKNRLLLKGTMMTLNMNDNKIDIYKNVFGEKALNADEKVHIYSDSAQLNGKTNFAQFLGNVRMLSNNFTIYSQRALFNFNKKTLTSAVLSEELKVVNENKEVTADKLVVDFIEKLYIFQGNGLMKSDDDSLSGDEIIVSEDGRKVQVKNAKATFDPKKPPSPVKLPKFDK